MNKELKSIKELLGAVIEQLLNETFSTSDVAEKITEWNKYIDELIEEEEKVYNDTHSSYFDGRIDMLHNLKIKEDAKRDII